MISRWVFKCLDLNFFLSRILSYGWVCRIRAMTLAFRVKGISSMRDSGRLTGMEEWHSGLT